MELNEQVGIQVQADIPKINFWTKHKKKIILFMGIIFFLLLFITVIFIPKSLNNSNQNNRAIITPPVAIITSTPALSKTTWASDSAVLKIENDNRNLTNDLINIDLSETALSLPNIDVKVDFYK